VRPLILDNNNPQTIVFFQPYRAHHFITKTPSPNISVLDLFHGRFFNPNFDPNKERKMKFLFLGKYSSAGLAGFLKNPEDDRRAAISAMVEK
jgi:uncharacterized protein with GYD domain